VIRTRKRYDVIAIALHLSVAGLVAVAFILGLAVDHFPKEDAARVINMHVLIGLTVLVLAIGRLFWRIAHPAPEFPQTVSALDRNVAKTIHAGLYILMIAVPIIGIPAWLWSGQEFYPPLTQAHQIAAFALIALVVGHVLVALYLQFIRHVDIFGRMI
jgi:cytochrome b561